MTRVCKKCNIEKSIEQFSPRDNGKYRYHRCRQCKTEAKNYLKGNYGITLEQFNKMQEQQEYSCAICHKSINEITRKKLVVDHNHKTGKVRKLLCYSCNSLIGECYEDTKILNSAIKYLNKYEN